MILRSLKLENFRSYTNYNITFEPVTVFVGPNGIGKTNLIEAIYMLSTGKSYRAKNDQDTIKWNKNYLRIVGKTSDKTLELFINSDPKQKNAKINDVKKRTVDLLGELKTTMFSPESVDIVIGAPKERRRFLDLILGQLDKEYLYDLIELQKVIKNRNSLLFGIKIKKSNPIELNFWNSKLIKLSNQIIAKRIRLIKYINSVINGFYKEIGGNFNNLQIKYVSSINDLERFDDILAVNEDREIYQGLTLFGPHRDNLEFILDGKNVTSFASRGEIRSVVFSLKMSELNFLKENKSKPILLLDDIFSELDKSRRHKLGEIISNQSTIITTTDDEFISSKLHSSAKVIKIDKINNGELDV
jgi:DNA replication and repair protein RecF